MTVLGFEQRSELAGGRRVRRAKFDRRSSLPVSAACVVANGVRETLAAALSVPVALRLLEPVMPSPDAWRAITADALLFGVRGPIADAVFVLRPRDALALAACAFGETAGEVRALSTLEHEVLSRGLRAVYASLAPVCGRELSPLERVPGIRGYTTYFELLVEQPAAFRLGVALSRDPLPRPARTLRIQDLLDVEIELTVEFGSGIIDGGAFLALEPGAHVPMKTRVGEPGLLKARDIVLARGECGALGDWNAMLVNGVERR